jgi:beta-glucosidase
MWNYELPLEQWVNDLVSHLTLDEKIAPMLNAAAANSRLGIPANDWWNAKWLPRNFLPVRLRH